MEITGLDIALRRINTIERQFQSLANTASNLDGSFQKILDNAVQSSNAQNTFKSGTYGINPTADKEKISKTEVNALIDKYSNAHGLDSDFVKALVNQESGFNPNATSRCGAMGLMQLMPATAEDLGVANAYDPEQNIYGGTKYLKGLMDRFGNNKELALAAYNAGPNAVKKYGGIPPYAETQNYVKNVMSAYNKQKGGN